MSHYNHNCFRFCFHKWGRTWAILSFEIGLSHSAWYLPFYPFSTKWHKFSFWLKNIPWCVCNHTNTHTHTHTHTCAHTYKFFNHFSVVGYFSCFHSLAIVKSAPLNMLI
jgi:hypothetical protein